MKHRWWVAALCSAAAVGLALPSRGLGVKDLLHIGSKRTELCVKKNAWIAYFNNGNGRMAPVRDTMNTDHDKDWLGLRFTNYDGPRIRLGVLKVINKSAESEERNSAEKVEVPVSGIQEMLTAALYNTKRFDVIEQKRIQDIKGQQDRKDTAEPSPASIRNVGKVLGAQYLVYGTVNEWSVGRAATEMEAKQKFGAGKKESEVAITFNLTDVANGQILFTTSERARLGEWNLAVKIFGGAGKTARKTPANYLLNVCANKAAFKIATYLRDRKWVGTIVEVKGPSVYVNAGSQQGMKPSLLLSVFKVKGIIKDAEGRMILGEDLQGIGTLSVDTVQPGFSIARIMNGCKGVKKTDRVELASQPAPAPVPPECAETL